MNFIVIILGISLVVLVYVLYLYMTPTYATLSSSASLSTANPAITTIVNPKSTSYAYGVWLYVNTWDSEINKIIFSRTNNLSVYLDATTPTLNVDVTMSDLSVKTIQITDNFPIQKWVYIIVSIDNTFLDCYLDGKLVLSHKLLTGSTMPHVPPDIGGAPIILGGNSVGNTLFDANVTRFIRWTSPVNPQIAWDSYMSGNSNSFLPSMSNYNANLSILKNNSAYSTFSIF